MGELYDLPDGWEWKKLKYVSTFQNGFAFKSKEFNNEGIGIQVIRIGNVLDLDKNKVFIDERKEFKKYILKQNDIVISMTGTRNKRDYLFPSIIGNNKYYLNQRVGKISVNKEINFKFLYYFLRSNIFRDNIFKFETGTVNQGNISSKNIENIDTPLPPLQEQKRIVFKLDTLFQKIDKIIPLHQKNMDEADGFMGSVLNEVFGELEEKYDKRKVGSFSKVGTGVTPLKSRNDFYENGSFNWITSKATNEDYVYESENLITNIALNECRLKLYPIGTIIIALYGQGKTRGQVSELMIETATNQALATVIVDKEIAFNKYLKYFLKKSYLDLRQKASGGTQPNLNLTIIKNMETPFPPLNIQQKTVNYLDQISEKTEKIKSIQKEKMESLKALKASLLDKAFRGEL